jgi:hypothetical protein
MSPALLSYEDFIFQAYIVVIFYIKIYSETGGEIA